MFTQQLSAVDAFPEVLIEICERLSLSPLLWSAVFFSVRVCGMSLGEPFRIIYVVLVNENAVCVTTQIHDK